MSSVTINIRILFTNAITRKEIELLSRRVFVTVARAADGSVDARWVGLKDEVSL